MIGKKVLKLNWCKPNFPVAIVQEKKLVWTLKEILNVTVVIQNVQVLFFFKRSEKMHKKTVQSKFKIKFFEK